MIIVTKYVAIMFFICSHPCVCKTVDNSVNNVDNSVQNFKNPLVERFFDNIFSIDKKSYSQNSPSYPHLLGCCGLHNVVQKDQSYEKISKILYDGDKFFSLP